MQSHVYYKDRSETKVKTSLQNHLAIGVFIQGDVNQTCQVAIEIQDKMQAGKKRRWENFREFR
jgi:hypothetical protein